MAKEILVALKRSDGINEVIPYIERIADSGMKVTFLFQYPIDGLGRLQAYCGMIETGIPSLVEVQKMTERYSWEGQKRLAKQAIFSACKGLLNGGTEIGVEIYSGSLRKAVRRYTSGGNVHLVMMRAGIGLKIMKFLQQALPVLGTFTRPSLPPVLMVHPRSLF